jgi:Kef-type K+ transport system membrane component KefB
VLPSVPKEPLTPAARAGLETSMALCQRVYRVATGVILTAFVLLILITTVSTGSFVQLTGKALYYVVLGGALLLAATWYRRTQLEKRARE